MTTQTAIEALENSPAEQVRERFLDRGHSLAGTLLGLASYLPEGTAERQLLERVSDALSLAVEQGETESLA
jgi:hypothetical protein